MSADRHCTASFSPGGAVPDLELTASPSEVTLNGQGWPANNPVTVNVTASCPGACSGDLVLNVGISAGGVPSARFYRYETSPTPGCTLTDDDLDNRFSATAVFLDCPLDFPSGGSASYQLKLWMQPSAGGVMPVQATWQGRQRVAPVTVPTAEIHPLVFVHGILGAMPPQNLLIDSRDGARAIFDPFLGHYWPILDTLLKMGYEWDRTLFGVAYDWRAPNEESAAFLKSVLAGEVIRRSRPWNVPYVSDDPRADLLVHSMGGLVARSYIQGSDWANDVRKVIFAATPHKGFPFDYRTWEGMTCADYVYDSAASASVATAAARSPRYGPPPVADPDRQAVSAWLLRHAHLCRLGPSALLHSCWGPVSSSSAIPFRPCGFAPLTWWRDGPRAAIRPAASARCDRCCPPKTLPRTSTATSAAPRIPRGTRSTPSSRA
jgi:hypothetical protein